MESAASRGRLNVWTPPTGDARWTSGSPQAAHMPRNVYMTARILVVLLVALASCTSQAQDDQGDGASADRRTPPSQALDSPSGARPDASGDDHGRRPGQSPQDSPSIASPVAREPNERLITPDGWGPLRIGMSTAEVTAAAGADASPATVGGPDADRCDEFRPSRALHP